MVDAKEGISYAEWLTQWQAPDDLARLTAAYTFVVLYDRDGTPQRVRGSSVAGMLEKLVLDQDKDSVTFESMVPAFYSTTDRAPLLSTAERVAVKAKAAQDEAVAEAVRATSVAAANAQEVAVKAAVAEALALAKIAAKLKTPKKK